MNYTNSKITKFCSKPNKKKIDSLKAIYLRILFTVIDLQLQNSLALIRNNSKIYQENSEITRLQFPRL